MTGVLRLLPLVLSAWLVALFLLVFLFMFQPPVVNGICLDWSVEVGVPTFGHALHLRKRAEVCCRGDDHDASNYCSLEAELC